MTKAPLTLLLSFVLVVAFCRTSPAEESIAGGDVVVVPLEGEVNTAQFAFLRRTLKDAEAAKAGAFIIDMDTPGGSLDAAIKILQLLLKAQIPTYTWINDDAGSAGALIALATDHIYMAPVSAVGAAAPVMGGGQEIPETMQSKTVSYFSGYFRSAAEAKGRNPELAEAFINKDKEFKIGDDVISAEGSLLTLSANEAVRKFDGKPLLADGIADSLDALKTQAGLTGESVIVEPSGFERVSLWITALAPLFLLGGIVAAYMEFKAPGFGVAGGVSIACFTIFFFGHYIAGLTGFEMPALFVLGLILVIAEVIFFPGVFFVAALGALLMLGALFLAMVDFYPGQPLVPNLSVLAGPALNLSLALVLATIAVVLLARFFPSLPLFRQLVLATNNPAGPSFEAPDPNRLPVSPGDSGVAKTVLRPSGKAVFAGTVVDAITKGEYLVEGTAVTAIAVRGGEVVVTSAENQA